MSVVKHSAPVARAEKRFTRHGKSYTARYDHQGELIALVNETTGEVVPSTTKSFRRLADGNRGNKFKAA